MVASNQHRGDESVRDNASDRNGAAASGIDLMYATLIEAYYSEHVHLAKHIMDRMATLTAIYSSILVGLIGAFGLTLNGRTFASTILLLGFMFLWGGVGIWSMIELAHTDSSIKMSTDKAAEFGKAVFDHFNELNSKYANALNRQICAFSFAATASLIGATVWALLTLRAR